MKNNNWYNWGYAMCIANSENLPNAVKSSHDIARVLSNISSNFLSDYTEIIKLENEEVSIPAIVKGIISLALKAAEGDVVTISFSMHGYYSHGPGQDFLKGGNNNIREKNIRFSERELYFLLKLFKPEVRVVLLMDICNSGTWLYDFEHSDPKKEERELDFFIKSINAVDNALAISLHLLKSAYYSKPIEASVVVYGAIGDGQFINDEICMGYYLKMCFEEKNHLKYTYEQLHQMMRAKAFWCLFNTTAADAPHSGISLWHTYFKDYLESSTKKMIDIKTVPDFNPKNVDHVKAINLMMPTMRYFGKRNNKFVNSFAFHVV